MNTESEQLGFMLCVVLTTLYVCMAIRKLYCTYMQCMGGLYGYHDDNTNIIIYTYIHSVVGSFWDTQ